MIFRQIIKQWFWDAYDHLGRLFLWNFLLFIFYSIAFFALAALTAMLVEEQHPTMGALVTFVLWTLAAPVLLLPWIAPLAHFGKLISLEKDPGFREFFRGFRQKLLRTWLILQVLVAGITVLLLNIWFYGFSEAFAAENRLLGFTLAGLCFWMGVFLVAVMLPALSHYLREESTLRASLKFGLLAALKYPGTVFGLLAFIISLWIIAAALRFVGILLFGFVGTYLFLNSLYDVLMERERKELTKEEQEEEPPRRPASWKEIKVEERAKEKERMDKSRYERTFRDIIRPWDS